LFFSVANNEYIYSTGRARAGVPSLIELQTRFNFTNENSKISLRQRYRKV